MSNVILTHDASVSAFDSASGAVSTDDDSVSFNWDEQHIVRVDAPSDLEGAFDTNRFYKIEDATLARPIKQRYMVDGELRTYKKPADELRKAAWSFDNAPYTLEHPSTGMVKDVNDVHGFFRNVHYTSDDRLNGNLYIPVNDAEAKKFAEENTDVSVGFFNRVTTDYDGDTGGLTDDDVDGFQTDMYGNHVAGVSSGRCSGEDGCGLDSGEHGSVVMEMTDSQHGYSVGDTVQWQDGSARGEIIDKKTEGCFSDRIDGDQEICAGDSVVYLIEENDGKTVAHKESTLSADATTTFEGENNMTPQFSEGDRVSWSADAIVAHNPDDEDGIMVEILDKNGNSTEMVTTVDEDDLTHMSGTQMRDSQHGDAPSGIYVAEDGTWLAVGPNEHPDENTDHPDDGKYVVDTCADVEDAWGLRGSGDIDITKETLANRIQRAAEAMSCDMELEEDKDTTTDMSNDDNPIFDVPDLSVDAIAAKNDAVASLRDERDELRDNLDEAETTIVDAFDEAEHFSVELDDDECPCEAVEDLVGDLDSKVDEVERLEDELEEYREDEREAALDELVELGADREKFVDESLDELETEIERREEILDAAPDTTVKDIDTDSDPQSSTDDNEETTIHGTRRFERGHYA